MLTRQLCSLVTAILILPAFSACKQGTCNVPPPAELTLEITATGAAKHTVLPHEQRARFRDQEKMSSL